MTRLKVGQVVFVLFGEHRAVLPARVIAENKTKTVNGTKTTYMIVFEIGNDKRKEMQVDESNVNRVFDTSKKAHNYLMQQASASVDAIIADAEKYAREWYKDDVEEPPDDVEDDEEPAKQHKTSTRPGPKVRLPDGRVANVIVSEPRSE